MPTTRTPRIAGWWLAGSVEDAGLIGGPGADLVRPRCRSQLRVRRAVAAARRTMRKQVKRAMREQWRSVVAAMRESAMGE